MLSRLYDEVHQGRGESGPNPAPSPAERELRELLGTLAAAPSRSSAVAAINELTRELEATSLHGAEVPKTLGRICFSSGLLLFLVGLAQALAESSGALGADGAVAPALALASGVVGGGICYQLGRKASSRRRAYRDRARALIKLLKSRLPPELT